MKRKRNKDIVVAPAKRSLLGCGPLDFALLILWVISLGLILWGIEIYRNTIMEPKYLFLVCSFGVLIVAAVLLFVLKGAYKAWQLIFLAAFIGGGIPYFVTLYINARFAGGEITSEVFDITKVGDLPGKRSRTPFVEIDYYGYEKQLMFSRTALRELSKYKQVRLEYRDGYLGFPVIRNKVLLE